MRVYSVAITVVAALLLIGAGAVGEPARGQTNDSPATVDVNTSRLEVAGGVVLVTFDGGDFHLPRDELLAWVSRSAEVVSRYYGRFPVASARIRLVPAAGNGVKTGRAHGENGAYLRVVVGQSSDEDDLKRDWVMVHEMVHLALPRMRRRHSWLSEGLAVYVESVARMQVGDLEPSFVWREFVERMPRGLPGPGDKGLDHTPTWGRTYWGGAIFSLIADIEIRKRTEGRMGLKDALRGVLAAGGDFETFWQIDRIFAAADKATGTTVLNDLYLSWRATPVDPDLAALWRSLGVEVRADNVRFDDGAPLAQLRQAIGRCETATVPAVQC